MRIGLFVPCYVDAIYPQVGVATYRLLTSLGLDVSYPQNQTCCGQPMGNAGFESKSARLAWSFEEMFRDFDYVVSPGASCAAYIRCFHPHILDRAGHDAVRCQSHGKTMDVVEFLHDVLRIRSLRARFPFRVSIHNSCHGVRELGLSSPSERVMEPFSKIRDLLGLVEGIEIVEPERKDECCGFGGMFSVEETAVSARMGLDKIRRHMATGAQYITGPDCSCLMHMQGIAKKEHLDIRFIHIVEILASGL